VIKTTPLEVEPSSTPSEYASICLSLSNNESGGGRHGEWIAALIRLGARVARYARHHPDRQLVVALSVPRRDFAATLIGCGWTLMSSPPPLDPPLDVLRELRPGVPVRVVTKDRVLLTHFAGIMGDRPYVRFGGTSRYLDGREIVALSVVPSIDKTARLDRVPPGTIGALSDRRLARPTADLALVGVLKSLRADMDVYLSCGNFPNAKPTRLTDLLLPQDPGVATWSTRLYTARGFDGTLPLGVRATILDGTGAMGYLREITSPVVFCIVDRSVADESAAESIVQYRNTRGEALSLRGDIGQPPPPGVEALAFTVAI
jgi:hypothetical protein